VHQVQQRFLEKRVDFRLRRHSFKSCRKRESSFGCSSVVYCLPKLHELKPILIEELFLFIGDLFEILKLFVFDGGRDELPAALEVGGELIVSTMVWVNGFGEIQAIDRR
jgi:hypothetical protein